MNKMKSEKLINETEELVTSMGLLVKRYLINSEYGQRPYIIDVRWQDDLDGVYHALQSLHELAGQTIPSSIYQALKKYTGRKDLSSEQVPSPDKFD